MLDFLSQAQQAIQSDAAKAEAICNDWLENDASNADAFHMRGMARLHQNKLEPALEDLKKAALLAPDNVQFFTSLGFAQKVSGDAQAAEHSFRHAVTINPDALLARYQLGNLCLEKASHSDWPNRFKKISVIIPSRLDKHPRTGMYWLDRSIQSVMAQSVAGHIDIEIVVGTDPGADIPAHFASMQNVIFAEAVPEKRKGQAAAINSAMARATGDVVTMIEDDDIWHNKRLEYGLHFLSHYDFVSSNQMEIDTDDAPQGLNDFPTPCGWMMRRTLWDEIGAMDEDFPCHLDTEWLGRLNQAQKLRCHIVESGAPVPLEKISEQRLQLLTLIRWIPPGSSIWRSPENHPLILRTIHPNSGMARIASDPVMNAKSREEHRLMQEKFGYYPW